MVCEVNTKGCFSRRSDLSVDKIAKDLIFAKIDYNSGVIFYLALKYAQFAQLNFLKSFLVTLITKIIEEFMEIFLAKIFGSELS